MSRSLPWFAGCVLLSAALVPSGSAADKKAPAGERVFGAAKVVPFHLTMTEKQFAALTPAGVARFGPPGFGPPRSPRADAHRNTFGVDLPWSKGELTFDGKKFED